MTTCNHVIRYVAPRTKAALASAAPAMPLRWTRDASTPPHTKGLELDEKPPTPRLPERLRRVVDRRLAPESDEGLREIQIAQEEVLVKFQSVLSLARSS